MSATSNTTAGKTQKTKRNVLSRPASSSILEGEYFLSSRIEVENDGITPAYKTKLLALFKQIEKEFDVLYQENQTLHDKIDLLNEKLEKDSYDKPDGIDFENNISKVLTKKLSVASQKSKTAHKLKAQTSKIVSSFKTPSFNCTLVKDYSGHKDGVWEVSVARPGVPVIGTASADHSAHIWGIESTRCLLQYQGHSGSVNSIRFHPSKDLVLTGSGDCSAHIWQAALNWDLPKGHSSEEELEDEMEDKIDSKIPALRTPVRELFGHTGAISGAEWIAGGEQIITASWDRLAILHDIETGSALVQLVGHDQELTYTASHPSQKLAVTSSRDTTFRLWDFRESVHSVSVFQGHAESVTSVVFTKEEKLVSSSDDRSVKVWDLKNMRSPVATIRLDSAVNRLSVSSNGIIAIPHDNRNIRLYDLNGQRMARLPRSSRQGHNRMVACAAWADEVINGINLFTCGFDRRVLGWSILSMKDL